MNVFIILINIMIQEYYIILNGFYESLLSSFKFYLDEMIKKFNPWQEKKASKLAFPVKAGKQDPISNSDLFMKQSI